MKKIEIKKIEIMDTTLRDGEQMQNVSYTTEEKLTISRILIEEVKIDRLEITSARASEGEKTSVKKIVEWAKSTNNLDRLEILSFVDFNKSIDWALSVGIKRINLLTKGSQKHCTGQLKKTKEEHFADIKKTIEYAVENDIEVNVYLEDFSNGINDSPEYVFYMIDNLITLPIKRILLPDTLGIFNPFTAYDAFSTVTQKYPDTIFEFHAHNDYGLAVANSLAAVKAGVKGIHVTVNGLGERAGNASLDEVVVGIKDFFGYETSIDEKKLYRISKFVEMFSGQRMAINKPIYGANVFIQTAGVHADGDKKGDLYMNPLKPERFNRKREYALGKLSGKSNLEINLDKLGIELDNNKKKILLKKIIELGDKKKNVTMEDLPYLIGDIFDSPPDVPFRILNCSLNSTYELRPFAIIRCSYKDEIIEASSAGDGGYDAFMNALRIILNKFNITPPKLTDYVVTIPPGGKTDALVQASICWEVIDANGNQKSITTRGVNSDQVMAAIEATVKIINIILTRNYTTAK